MTEDRCSVNNREIRAHLCKLRLRAVSPGQAPADGGPVARHAPVGKALRPSQTLPDHPAAGSLRRLDPTAPFDWADLGGGVGRLQVLHCCRLGGLLLVASYHLSVSVVSRGRGQSAVAGAAYRAGETLHCEREGVTHDYSRKGGVETAFVLAPSEAPQWASERNALWNAAEAAEGRKNSVVAREWRLALPSELSSEKRVALAEGFGRELVARYGVAVDVAVHAPHREGDDRNWHAHLYTTTREVGADGLGAKTRVLDGAGTGRGEIMAMRAVWAEAQNEAYREAGIDASVDHRSLEAQREEALEKGDEVAAALLERVPEPRLGVAATNMERKARREALAEGREYAPVTERGMAVEEARGLRGIWEAALKGVDVARDSVQAIKDRAVGAIGAAREARDAGASWIAAGLEALKAVELGPEAGKGAADGTQAASEGQGSAEAARAVHPPPHEFEALFEMHRQKEAQQDRSGDGPEGGRDHSVGAEHETSKDRAERRIANIQQQRDDQEKAKLEKQESQALERDQDDEGREKIKAPQEHRIEQELRDQEIERMSNDRGWDFER